MASESFLRWEVRCPLIHFNNRTDNRLTVTFPTSASFASVNSEWAATSRLHEARRGLYFATSVHEVASYRRLQRRSTSAMSGCVGLGQASQEKGEC